MQPEDIARRVLEKGRILGDSVRLAIALYLSIKGKARFSEVARGLGISAGKLAHHLRMMEEAGYVKVERVLDDLRGRELRLTPEGARALMDFIGELLSSRAEERSSEYLDDPT